jgi:hypothetical protein
MTRQKTVPLPVTVEGISLNALNAFAQSHFPGVPLGTIMVMPSRQINNDIIVLIGDIEESPQDKE